MASMRRFEDSWKRIDRATMHAEAFASQWAGLIDPEAKEVGIKRKNDGTWVAFAIHKVNPEHDLAIELGEFFYQLRAALDGMIFKAVIIQGKVDPPANESTLEFPIYPTKGKFEGCAAYRAPFPEKLKAWFEAIQPYNTGKPGYAETADMRRLLTLLHNCARKDRHRRLHVVAAIPTSVEWKFDISPGGKISNVRELRPNFLENESEFLAFHASGVSGPDSYFKLATGVTIEISVAEIPGLTGQGVMLELARIIDAVRYIVEKFEVGYR